MICKNIRKGSLVYVSNGPYKGYGYFDRIEKDCDNSVFIDCAVETSIGDSNDCKIDFRTHMISKVTELHIASAQEKKEYKNLLIKLSKWNSTHYKQY